MTYYFVFCKEDILLEKTADGTYTIPLQEEPPVELKPWTHLMNITPLDGIDVKTYNIDQPITNHPRYEMCPLRQSYYRLPRPLYLKAGKCQELLYWDHNTKYCGICGAPMRYLKEVYRMRQRDMATAGHCRHRTHPSRRRSTTGTCKELQARFLWTRSRLRRNGRDAGGSRSTRSPRGNRCHHNQHPLFQFAALALSMWANGRFQCRLCQRRPASPAQRDSRWRMVPSQQSPQHPRATQHCSHASRQLD